MEEFIAYLVKNIVESPDDVRVVVTEGDPLRVDIHCAPTDIARVIGRQGRTIQALRTLATTAGARLGHRVRLDVVEENREEK